MTVRRETQHLERKTPNAEHRMAFIRWIGDVRVSEEAPKYGIAEETDSTPNAQRPTSNAQWKRRPRFDLEERLLEFSTRIIRLVDALPNTRAANHVAGQVLRYGTSPYGNHGEVEAAESLKDFTHKLKVCLKELKETRRWLRLNEKFEMLSGKNMIPILVETEELIRIFFSSIRTAAQNAK